MKKDKNLINRLISLVIISFGLIPLIPGSKKGVLIVILFILALISFFKSENKKLNYKTFLINVSLYVFYLLSLIYTTNISKGIKIITETRLSVLLLPLIFLFLSSNKSIYSNEILKKFKKVFIYSTFALSLYLIFYLPYVKVSANPVFDFPSVYFFRNSIIDLPILGLDPIYYSLYLGVSIIFIITGEKQTSFFNRFNFFGFVFIIALLAISSKMAILALFLLLTIYFMKKVKIKAKALIIFSSILLIVMIFQIPTINTRAKELLNKETYTTHSRNNSTSIRISILKCGYNVSSNNLLLGVGVGDVKEELINCYKTISNDLVYYRYNSHNQYLSILLSTGIFGLLTFLYFLHYNLKLSNKIMDKSFYYILMFYAINFFSENIIERQNGVILFYFLICFFSHYVINNKINIEE